MPGTDTLEVRVFEEPRLDPQTLALLIEAHPDDIVFVVDALTIDELVVVLISSRKENGVGV